MRQSGSSFGVSPSCCYRCPSCSSGITPNWGETYHVDGSPMFTGVGHQKNDLGLMCLMAGIYLFWELLQRREKTHPAFIRQHKIIAVVLTGMLAWLLHMSDSQTSFVCLVAAVLLLLLGRTPFIARRPAQDIWRAVLRCPGDLASR